MKFHDHILIIWMITVRLRPNLYNIMVLLIKIQLKHIVKYISNILPSAKIRLILVIYYSMNTITVKYRIYGVSFLSLNVLETYYKNR